MVDDHDGDYDLTLKNAEEQLAAPGGPPTGGRKFFATGVPVVFHNHKFPMQDFPPITQGRRASQHLSKTTFSFKKLPTTNKFVRAQVTSLS